MIVAYRKNLLAPFIFSLPRWGITLFQFHLGFMHSSWAHLRERAQGVLRMVCMVRHANEAVDAK